MTKRSSPFVSASKTKQGIKIEFNDSSFPINYPESVWSKTSEHLKDILIDNLALASTLYIPSILKSPSISYSTARPLSESFLLRNGIYDTTYCANVDGKSSLEYLKNFFNTQYVFESNDIKIPTTISTTQKAKSKQRALILFSFGKESLLSYALCKELGLDTTLVSIIHPGFKYEWEHKQPLIKQFEEEFNETVHTIDYQPGLLKEGKFWNTPTELGWGLHVTEYAMLSLPFAEVDNCDFILCGNEQSCHDIYIDEEGVLVYRAGLDQHRDWTAQQSLLQTLLIGRSLPAISLVEPLYEIAETKILHTRYPEIAKYQMSCFASKEGAKGNRWCEECDKCAYMYALFKAFNLDMQKIGFTKDLFDTKHAHLYETFFSRTDSSHFYGSQGELGLGFYLACKNGCKGASIERFKKELLSQFEREIGEHTEKYLGIHPTDNIPSYLHDRVMSIYREELTD